MSQEARKLQNELVFRDANERIRRAQSSMELDGLLPFICECWDERCRQIVHLTVAEYEAIRKGDLRFLVAPEHDVDDGRVTERNERFWVLQKGHGRPGS